ncbi:MAG: hypothetical protein P5683_03900 [Limnospira sp. PMC 1279.21]|uniref:Replication restart DNA helicase PriA n=1 Tax=Limnospira fusiformis PMC 851.14 TaxID=2219512 RepID=A0ABU9EN07_LIMFS|nr:MULTISPECIES: hypothetical protein [Limnospira]MDC0839695.1 hypothetical protein [Limnoraphis robusta]MDT9238075.1 hypothetical protein [Limnospira sp. PMC 1261.20]MDT9268612.1 hypothetical protein [Limnospira sp. PMC 1234.20]QJB28931.1 hypothetical protein HFV01_28000 [Limnospira fusiformis SAG 85.79]MDT9197186.1 hypothetical protein [Limnospira sp. PMC 1042.18]
MNCPCCSGELLLHCSHHGLYWQCQNCRLTLPASETLDRLLFEASYSEKHSPTCPH